MADGMEYPVGSSSILGKITAKSTIVPGQAMVHLANSFSCHPSSIGEDAQAFVVCLLSIVLSFLVITLSTIFGLNVSIALLAVGNCVLGNEFNL